MIKVLQAEELTRWFVVFWPGTVPGLDPLTRWVPGQFKHVSAFAWSNGCNVWVWYDVGLRGKIIRVLPGTKESELLLGQWTVGCSVLFLEALSTRRRRLTPFSICTTATRQLLGLPGGALLPDGFWRDCIRHGAKIIVDGTKQAASPGPATDCSGRADGRREYSADSVEP